MPFTPFHFGPGLLVKAAVPRGFWFTSFVLANVLIDCEVLYYMRLGEPPLHRYLHTYVAGVGLGVLSGVVMSAALVAVSSMVPGRWWQKSVAVGAGRRIVIPSIIAGVIGGVSHVLLDSLLYAEMHPYWPLAAGNDLAGIVSSEAVYGFCALTGLAGAVFWPLLRG